MFLIQCFDNVSQQELRNKKFRFFYRLSSLVNYFIVLLNSFDSYISSIAKILANKSVFKYFTYLVEFQIPKWKNHFSVVNVIVINLTVILVFLIIIIDYI